VTVDLDEAVVEVSAIVEAAEAILVGAAAGEEVGVLYAAVPVTVRVCAPHPAEIPERRECHHLCRAGAQWSRVPLR